jgi:SAM-dependent methyltransferase
VRDPKTRFSDRVVDYARYRPGYPRPLLEMLANRCNLVAGCSVADVGSGTGILSQLLLDRGAVVYAVEPNLEMRLSAEVSLGSRDRFHSISATAEATALASASVDLITAAQAFHWFAPVATRAEFARILRPKGFVALIWNQRRDCPFNDDYEQMLAEFAPEYAEVHERNRASEPKLRSFFAPSVPEFERFDHQQLFDEEGLRGRLASSSYAPKTTDALHAPIMQRVSEIFARHARDGRVTFPYETIVWYGHLA